MARQTYKELLKRWQDNDRLTYEGYGDPPLRQEPSRYAKKEAHIDGLGTIFYCEHPDFKSSLEAIMKECDEVISLRDLAYARIKAAKSSTLLHDGSFVREGSLLIPKKENRRIALRKSLVMEDPGDYGCYEVAIDQCYLPENFNVDAYLEQIGKDNYLILNDISRVPANRLGEDERAVWLYQDQAKNYGLFLESMAEMRLIYGSYKKVTPELIIDMIFASDELIDKQPRPYAHQLLLSGLSFGGRSSLSYISGDSMGAGVGYRIRGLHREPAEGGAQKNDFRQ
jgi:hypothetical protein